MLLIPSFFKVWHAVCLPLPFFQVVHFVTSFVFQLLHPVRLPLPFVSSRSFRYTSFLSFLVLHPLRLPPPFLSRVHFIASVLSLQLYASIRYFFPIRFNSFKCGSLLLSLSFQLFAPVPYTSFLSFWTLLFPSLLSSHRFNASILFIVIYLFLSFHGVHFVTSLPFVSMCSSSSFTSSFRFKPFISLPPFLSFFRFNSSFLFVLLFLSFQLVHFIASVLSLQLFPSIRYRYFLPFVSTLFSSLRYSFPSLSTLPFRFLYGVPFASSLLFRPLLPPHRFNASILFI